jgi:hypothetical protein
LHRPAATDAKAYRIIWDEEAKIGIAQHRGDTDKTGAATRDNADVLPGVLAGLALAMVLVVEVGHGMTERLDAGGWAVLTSGHGDIDGVGTLEAALDVFETVLADMLCQFRGRLIHTIFDLRSTLAQVGPALGIVEVAMLVGTLGGPHYTSGSTGRVEPSVRLVAFMSLAELLVRLRLLLCICGSARMC